MKPSSQRSLTALLCISTALASGTILVPQSASAEDITVQEIVVTGSNVPTTPDSVANKVSIIDSDAIKEEGTNDNLLEILRKALPVFAGRSNTGDSNANNNNQNTAGGSQMQLRNLDTLVLIDGERVAYSAIAGVNGKQFVDVNQIPSAAIDRVEVLTDGSSAVYGSDAVGGVVNVILKTDYEGGEFGSRVGAAANYAEESGYFIYGFGYRGLHVTVTGTDTHSDPLVVSHLLV